MARGKNPVPFSIYWKGYDNLMRSPYNIKVKEPKKFRQGLVPYAIAEDINPEDVDLSSFEIQKDLNPKLWKNGKLDTRIRLLLLDIADDFIASCDDLRRSNIIDIVITGSLCNYNWSNEFSDVDLHIVVDGQYPSAKQCAKKWNSSHKDIRICGFPLELYVQDENEKLFAAGVFSLDTNEWLKVPDREKLEKHGIDDGTVKATVAKYINAIDKTERIADKGGDYNERRAERRADNIFTDIKAMRKDGFSRDTDELNPQNIAFKKLRRDGYIEKISKIRDKAYDRLHSL